MSSIIKGETIVEKEGGPTLTYADMQELIRKEVSKLYYKYKAIHIDYDIEDIVNEVCLYYLSPMKHSDETRIDHYVKLYDGDINHLTNLFKLSARQWLIVCLRNKNIKHRGLSLNTLINVGEDRVAELQDLIADESVHIDSDILEQDYLNGLVEDLRKYNTKYLYLKAKTKNKALSELEFICNPQNIIDVGTLNDLHLKLINDIISGYKVWELKLKYQNYNYLIKALRETFNQRRNLGTKTI